jgi:hypothetical protein
MRWSLRLSPSAAEDLVALRDPLGAFELDPEQQFARRVERPRVAALAVFGFGDPPDCGGGGFRAAPARADAEEVRRSGRRSGLAAHPGERGGQGRIDALLVVRVAAAFDKGAHRARGLRLAQEDAMRAAPEDLAELPGVVADIGVVSAVDRSLDDDRRGAVARAGRAALDEADQIFGEPRHSSIARLMWLAT